MASKFWVGGTNTWDSTAGLKWSSTSGGVGGAARPSATDDVFFNVSSTGIVTLSNDSQCRSLNCTGFTGTILHPQSIEFIIGDTGGSDPTDNIGLKLAPGMTYTTGGNNARLSFVSRSPTTHTIDLANKTNIGSIFFNALGGSYQFVSSFIQQNTSNFTLRNGAVDLNSQIASIGITTLDAGTKSLTLGSAQITVIGSSLNFGNNSTGFSLDAGTSQITFHPTASVTPSFTAGPNTYYDVNITKSSGGWGIAGSFNSTFHNLTQDNRVIGGGNRVMQLVIGTTVTITGTLTYIGNNPTNSRGRLLTTSAGESVTIDIGTTGTLALTHVDCEDINVIGTNTPVVGTVLGDGAGNTNIVFPAPVTYYWIGDGGDMGDSAHWSLSSGGAPGPVTDFPLLHDRAVFDDNSFTLSGQVVRNNLMRAPSFSFLGVSNNPTYNPINPNGAGNFVYGDFILDPTMTYTCTGAAGGAAAHTFKGRGDYVLDFGGLENPSNVSNTVQSPGGSYSLGSDLLMDSTRVLGLSQGEFNANGHNVTIGQLSSNNSMARSLLMGSGTWNLSGTGIVWNTQNGTNLTMDAIEASVMISNTSSSEKVISSNLNRLFGKLVIAGGPGVVRFSNSISSTITYLTIVAPANLVFNSPATYTFGTVHIIGSLGNVITIQTNNPGTQATFSSDSEYIDANYLDLKDIKAQGGAAWYAGANSIDGGNNTGWIFASAPIFNAPGLAATTSTPGVASEVYQNVTVNPSQLTAESGIYEPMAAAQQYEEVAPLSLGLLATLLEPDAEAQQQTEVDLTAMMLTALLNPVAVETQSNISMETETFTATAQLDNPTIYAQQLVNFAANLLSVDVSLLEATVLITMQGKTIFGLRRPNIMASRAPLYRPHYHYPVSGDSHSDDGVRDS